MATYKKYGSLKWVLLSCFIPLFFCTYVNPCNSWDAYLVNIGVSLFIGAIVGRFARVIEEVQGLQRKLLLCKLHDNTDILRYEIANMQRQLNDLKDFKATIEAERLVKKFSIDFKD